MPIKLDSQSFLGRLEFRLPGSFSQEVFDVDVEPGICVSPIFSYLWKLAEQVPGIFPEGKSVRLVIDLVFKMVRISIVAG